MAQDRPARGVAGLDEKGVERPEARFGKAEERPPAEPADGAGREHENDRRPEPDLWRGDIVRDRPEPHGRDYGNETEQDARDDEEERPGDDELGQADLDQHAAREREHRALLRARSVILDVAP